jgi:hypothetical protein
MEIPASITAQINEINLTIDAVQPNGLIRGKYEIPRNPAWGDCTFERAHFREKTCVGLVLGNVLLIGLGNWFVYDLKLQNDTLTGTGHSNPP